MKLSAKKLFITTAICFAIFNPQTATAAKWNQLKCKGYCSAPLCKHNKNIAKDCVANCDWPDVKNCGAAAGIPSPVPNNNPPAADESEVSSLKRDYWAKLTSTLKKNSNEWKEYAAKWEAYAKSLKPKGAAPSTEEVSLKKEKNNLERAQELSSLPPEERGVMEAETTNAKEESSDTSCPKEITLEQLKILKSKGQLEHGWGLSGWGIHSATTEEESKAFEAFSKGEKKIMLIPMTNSSWLCQYGQVGQKVYFNLIKEGSIPDAKTTDVVSEEENLAKVSSAKEAGEMAAKEGIKKNPTEPVTSEARELIKKMWLIEEKTPRYNNIDVISDLKKLVGLFKAGTTPEQLRKKMDENPKFFESNDRIKEILDGIEEKTVPTEPLVPSIAQKASSSPTKRTPSQRSARVEKSKTAGEEELNKALEKRRAKTVESENQFTQPQNLQEKKPNDTVTAGKEHWLWEQYGQY